MKYLNFSMFVRRIQKLGGAVAVTIPKKLGLRVGQYVRIDCSDDSIRIRPLKEEDDV